MRKRKVPVKPMKKGNVWIVVEADTGKRSKSSGAFKTKKEAQAQAAAINASISRRKK